MQRLNVGIYSVLAVILVTSGVFPVMAADTNGVQPCNMEGLMMENRPDGDSIDAEVFIIFNGNPGEYDHKTDARSNLFEITLLNIATIESGVYDFTVPDFMKFVQVGRQKSPGQTTSDSALYVPVVIRFAFHSVPQVDVQRGVNFLSLSFRVPRNTPGLPQTTAVAPLEASGGPETDRVLGDMGKSVGWERMASLEWVNSTWFKVSANLVLGGAMAAAVGRGYLENRELTEKYTTEYLPLKNKYAESPSPELYQKLASSQESLQKKKRLRNIYYGVGAATGGLLLGFNITFLVYLPNTR